jgi:hypothetical protein
MRACSFLFTSVRFLFCLRACVCVFGWNQTFLHACLPTRFAGDSNHHHSFHQQHTTNCPLHTFKIHIRVIATNCPYVELILAWGHLSFVLFYFLLVIIARVLCKKYNKKRPLCAGRLTTRHGVVYGARVGITQPHWHTSLVEWADVVDCKSRR